MSSDVEATTGPACAPCESSAAGHSTTRGAAGLSVSTISWIETGKRTIGLDALSPSPGARRRLDELFAADDTYDVVIRRRRPSTTGSTAWTRAGLVQRRR